MKRAPRNKDGMIEYAILLVLMVTVTWVVISLVTPSRQVSNFLAEIKGTIMKIDFRPSSESTP